jgi:hypothetical protein
MTVSLKALKKSISDILLRCSVHEINCRRDSMFISFQIAVCLMVSISRLIGHLQTEKPFFSFGTYIVGYKTFLV